MNQDVDNYQALLSAFIEANRKLASGLISLDSYDDDHIKALEVLGRNVAIIRDLLWK